MKKIFTIMVPLFLANAAMAQSQLPNTNFETWFTDVDNHDSLGGWSSSNTVVMYPVVSLRKETDALQGDFAAKVTTAPFGFVQYSTLGILVNGTDAEFLYGGGGGGGNVSYVSGGGTPISIKPSELKGYYKYVTGSATDRGLAKVLLTKYNTTTQQRDTVSYENYHLMPQANYSAFTIPLTDLMPGVNPDTITTIFYSSDVATLAPNGVFSDLFLDSLTLTAQPTPPHADFTADITTGNTATIVTFSDNSTNTPTSWSWTFTPNNVDYQSATTATSANPIVKFTAAGDYTVKLRVENADGADSLTKTNYIHIEEVTGINELPSDRNPIFYPNPATDKIYINAAYLGASLTLYDVYGKTVKHALKVSGPVLDVATLAPGFYFISLSKGDRSYYGKLLIQHQ